ncbi:MAG: flagellar export protein FliJ [Betaproteobacteria bacterium]
MTIRPRQALRLAGLATCMLGLTSGSLPAADATTEIADLRARLQAQRQQLDEQQRQLRAQEARLREQERLLDELAARAGVSGAAAPAAAPPASAPPPRTASAPPDPAPGPPVVTGRFDGIQIRIGGALRTTVTTTTARMQPDSTPFFVLPGINGVSDGTSRIDARLSSLFFSIDGAQLGDYKLGGSIFGYLFDGDLLSGKYGFYPGFAFVEATSERWRHAAGLQMDVFSPLMPTMVDRMSAFAGSGNPGNSFRPQLRTEYTVPAGSGRWQLQAALADPVASNFKAPANAGAPGRYTENTGLPNIEARVAWTRGRPGEEGIWVPWPEMSVGLSAVTGRMRSFDVVGLSAINAWETRIGGVALEGSWRVGSQLGLQGEIYTGRALGQYLASVFQTIGTNRQPVPSRGGWGELAWWWTPTVHSHTGYGIDRADSEYVPAGGFLSNQTAFMNLFWDPSPRTTLAVEGTWRRTAYQGLGAHSGLALMLSSELRF